MANLLNIQEKQLSNDGTEECLYPAGLLTIDELAVALRVRKSWIYAQTRLRGKDTIPVLRVGKYLRFDPVEVMSWLKRRQND